MGRPEDENNGESTMKTDYSYKRICDRQIIGISIQKISKIMSQLKTLNQSDITNHQPSQWKSQPQPIVSSRAQQRHQQSHANQHQDQTESRILYLFIHYNKQ